MTQENFTFRDFIEHCTLEKTMDTGTSVRFQNKFHTTFEFTDTGTIECIHTEYDSGIDHFETIAENKTPQEQLQFTKFLQ